MYTYMSSWTLRKEEIVGMLFDGFSTINFVLYSYFLFKLIYKIGRFHTCVHPIFLILLFFFLRIVVHFYFVYLLGTLVELKVNIKCRICVDFNRTY